MFVLKPWLPRPRRGDRTRLPAALAALLALLAVGQAVAVPDAAAPAAVGVQRPLVLAPVIVPRIMVPAEIVARDVFSAGRGLGTETADPVGGAVAVGIVRDRGAARAFVAAPGGKLRTMRVGDAIDGWLLVGIAPDALVFRRGGATVRLALSAGKPPETDEEGVVQ